MPSASWQVTHFLWVSCLFIACLISCSLTLSVRGFVVVFRCACGLIPVCVRVCERICVRVCERICVPGIVCVHTCVCVCACRKVPALRLRAGGERQAIVHHSSHRYARQWEAYFLYLLSLLIDRATVVDPHPHSHPHPTLIRFNYSSFQGQITKASMFAQDSLSMLFLYFSDPP